MTRALQKSATSFASLAYQSFPASGSFLTSRIAICRMPAPRTVPQRNPHPRQGGPSIKHLRDACRSSITAGAINIGQALFAWLQIALSSDAGGVAGDRLNQKQLHLGNTAQSHQAA